MHSGFDINGLMIYCTIRLIFFFKYAWGRSMTFASHWATFKIKSYLYHPKIHGLHLIPDFDSKSRIKNAQRTRKATHNMILVHSPYDFFLRINVKKPLGNFVLSWVENKKNKKKSQYFLTISSSRQKLASMLKRTRLYLEFHFKIQM